MARFIIKEADKTTGEDITLTVSNLRDEQHAMTFVQEKGMVVSTVSLYLENNNDSYFYMFAEDCSRYSAYCV
ncbi:MAG: hypothetical protein MI744_19900 [Pseudomonadales bacterium]|nr:hypothetical protein [Pseudomonadales bacterium]